MRRLSRTLRGQTFPLSKPMEDTPQTLLLWVGFWSRGLWKGLQIVVVNPILFQEHRIVKEFVKAGIAQNQSDYLWAAQFTDRKEGGGVRVGANCSMD